MKRKIVILFLLVLCLSGCKKEKSKIEQLIDKGYQLDSTCGSSVGLRKGSEELEDFIILTFDVSQAIQEKIDNLDFFSDSYWDDLIDLYAKCEVVDETNCMEYLPSNQDVQKYVGLTLVELKREGFDECGSISDETGVIYDMDNGYYCIKIKMDPKLNYETINNYSYNEILKTKIVEVEVAGLSMDIVSTLNPAE